jgi:hypothetical protein
MRPESDVYSIDTEDTPEIDSVNTAGGFEDHLSGNDALFGEAAIAQNKTVAPGRDDRKSYRYPMPKARQSCELKVGDDLLPAVLLDESKGGFAILIDRLNGLKSGKKAELHTDMGWFKVRIVYIKSAERPAYSDPSSDCWFRLGLRKARSFFLF